MENKENLIMRKRYHYKENILIDFFLLINIKHILYCFYNKKNYILWYKNIKKLFPERTKQKLKTKILNVIKFKFKNFIIEIDKYLPSLKFQIQNEIVLPNKNHFKYYFKYLNDEKKKNNFSELKININYYLIFINSQENLFSYWLYNKKDKKLDSFANDDDLVNLLQLKIFIKRINNLENIEKIKFLYSKLNLEKIAEYLNKFSLINKDN